MISWTMKLTRLFALAVALGVVYVRFLRSPILNWGATTAETGAPLPGDELLTNPDTVATRAIDIDAPASAVWPWIAQMGPSPRGGAYTYDWIENLLGLNMLEGSNTAVARTTSTGRFDRPRIPRDTLPRSAEANAP